MAAWPRRRMPRAGWLHCRMATRRTATWRMAWPHGRMAAAHAPVPGSTGTRASLSPPGLPCLPHASRLRFQHPRIPLSATQLPPHSVVAAGRVPDGCTAAWPRGAWPRGAWHGRHHGHVAVSHAPVTRQHPRISLPLASPAFPMHPGGGRAARVRARDAALLQLQQAAQRRARVPAPAGARARPGQRGGGRRVGADGGLGWGRAWGGPGEGWVGRRPHSGCSRGRAWGRPVWRK
jgi:hypothetical protein